MGRKNKDEPHVKPYLDKIQAWYEEFDERQIATERLGISVTTFENYKKKYPELREVLKKGKEGLITDLRQSLKKKAKGFYYEETKTCIREVNGKKVSTVEKYKKYAPPDVGAIHLLLKNLDPEWKNDDQTTIDMKKKQLELTERKIDQNEW